MWVHEEMKQTAKTQTGKSGDSVNSLCLDSFAGLWFTLSPEGLLGPGNTESRTEASEVAHRGEGSVVNSCLSYLSI